MLSYHKVQRDFLIHLSAGTIKAIFDPLACNACFYTFWSSKVLNKGVFHVNFDAWRCSFDSTFDPLSIYANWQLIQMNKDLSLVLNPTFDSLFVLVSTTVEPLRLFNCRQWFKRRNDRKWISIYWPSILLESWTETLYLKPR